MAAQFENNRDISYVNLRCLFAPIFQRKDTRTISYYSTILCREVSGEFIAPCKNLTCFEKYLPRFLIDRSRAFLFFFTLRLWMILTFPRTNMYGTGIGSLRINESVLVSKGPETRVAPGGKWVRAGHEGQRGLQTIERIARISLSQNQR